MTNRLCGPVPASSGFGTDGGQVCQGSSPDHDRTDSCCCSGVVGRGRQIRHIEAENLEDPVPVGQGTIPAAVAGRCPRIGAASLGEMIEMGTSFDDLAHMEKNWYVGRGHSTSFARIPVASTEYLDGLDCLPGVEVVLPDGQACPHLHARALSREQDSPGEDLTLWRWER